MPIQSVCMILYFTQGEKHDKKKKLYKDTLKMI